MKTNNKVRKVKIVFGLFVVVLLFFIGCSYTILKQQYVSQTNFFIDQMMLLYPQVDIPSVLLYTQFNFTIEPILYIILGFLMIMLGWMYYHITHYFKSYSKDIRHIISQMEDDDFIPSILEGDLGLLEDKIYTYKKKSQQLIELNEREKKQLSDYVENMAHQIKTPIASIRLNEEMAILSKDLSMLEDNQVSFDRLNQLFENFMKLSRLENETIHIELVQGSVYELFREVKCEIQPILNGVVLNMEPCDVLFHYDLNWLSEAIYNIIKNDIEEGVSEITMYAYYNQELLHIVVKDNGKGIDEEDLPYIFNRFYRCHNNKKKGIGIGLSLSKEIVEKHHGFISAYNDEGAVFDLSFPYLDVKEKVI